VPPGYYEHRWEWLDRPTPPVTSGGLAIYGVSDGLVRAVNIGDGAEAWTYHAGGPVLTAPAVSEGRVYVGGGDGWVHCLDAASGKRGWKWRGAPVDRLMPVYGKLMSSWPVMSVMVDGSTVYGVAGHFEANGSVFFALDAQTGKPRWTRWRHNEQEAISVRTARMGRAGYLALVGREVPADRYTEIPGLFDASNGQPPTTGTTTLLALPDAGEQDVISFGDRVFLRGGNDLLENPDRRVRKYAGTYTLFERSEDPVAGGKARFRGKRPLAIPRSHITPSIEGDAITMVGGQGNRGRHTATLSLWSRETLVDTALNQDYRDRWHNGFDLERARWAHPELEVNAVVLCRNAVVAVAGIMEPPEEKYGPDGKRRNWPAFTAWKLNAYAREDGRELWSVDLPGEPVMNGLAPAADGSWVLTLRDGSLAIVGNGE
jgi:hypothetical protein